MAKVENDRIKIIAEKETLQIAAWLPKPLVLSFKEFVKLLNNESTSVQKITEKVVIADAISEYIENHKGS